MKHTKLIDGSKAMRAFKYEKKSHRKGRDAIAWTGRRSIRWRANSFSYCHIEDKGLLLGTK